MNINRNAPCWCGSNKKYKHCHLEFDKKLASYAQRGAIIPPRSIIKTPEQIQGIKESSKINTAVLDLVSTNIKAGMSTEEINTLVHEFTISQGAIPAPLNFQGYPKSVCTSINDEVCHGIPSPDVILENGDIINVDVSTIYNGYFSDASRMFKIGEVHPNLDKLVDVAKECLEKGLEAAKPILLEPIMNVQILVPDSYMGDVMGDINKRRGRVIGMEPEGKVQKISAEIPMAEMFSYATDLRSMTQARGNFTSEFLRYDEVPASELGKILDDVRNLREEA